MGGLGSVRIREFLYLGQAFRCLNNTLLGKVGPLLPRLIQVFFEGFERLAQLQLLQGVVLVEHACDFLLEDWAGFFSAWVEGVQWVIHSRDQRGVLLADGRDHSRIIQTFRNGRAIVVQLFINGRQEDIVGGGEAVRMLVLVARTVQFQNKLLLRRGELLLMHADCILNRLLVAMFERRRPPRRMRHVISSVRDN